MNNNKLGKWIKLRRLRVGLTLNQLGAMSGVSTSYLSRIERRERFPSASVLRKIAKPLGIKEVQLLIAARLLSRQSSTKLENPGRRRLDPYVAAALSQEPLDVQRTVIGMLSTLKSVAKGVIKE